MVLFSDLRSPALICIITRIFAQTIWIFVPSCWFLRLRFHIRVLILHICAFIPLFALLHAFLRTHTFFCALMLVFAPSFSYLRAYPPYLRVHSIICSFAHIFAYSHIFLHFLSGFCTFILHICALILPILTPFFSR